MDDDVLYSSDESEQLDQIRKKLARRHAKAAFDESSSDDDESTTQLTRKSYESLHITQIGESTAVDKADKHIDSDDDTDEFANDTNVLLAILNGDAGSNVINGHQLGGGGVQKLQNTIAEKYCPTDQGLLDNGTNTLLCEKNISTSMNRPCSQNASIIPRYKEDTDRKYSTICHDSFYGVGLSATPCEEITGASSHQKNHLEQNDQDNASFSSCDISSDSYLCAVNAAMDKILSPNQPGQVNFGDTFVEPLVSHNYQCFDGGRERSDEPPSFLSPLSNPLGSNVDIGSNRVDNSLRQKRRMCQLDQVDISPNPGKEISEGANFPRPQSTMHLNEITLCDNRDFGNTNYPTSALAKTPFDSTFLANRDRNVSEVSTEMDRSEILGDDSKRKSTAPSLDIEANEIDSVELLPSYEEEIHGSFIPEMDYRLFAPPSSCLFNDPILHNFTLKSKPKWQRPSLSISELFGAPLDQIWNSRYKKFNHMQSELANILAYSDDRIIVTAPTGAGKTVVFEMAIARFFDEDLKRFADRNARALKITKSRKIIYLSPNKALCEERYQDWSCRLGAINLGLEVTIVTGDGDPSESFREIANAHLIITTPEKWDSVTRRWSENFVLFSTVKLVLIDEVHHLADECRGSCLEAVICRMKTIQRAASTVNYSNIDISESRYANTTADAISSPLRIITVSATLPNIVDIAKFIEATEAFAFDDSYRPVPLTTYVIGQGKLGDKNSSHYHFWKNIGRGVPEIVRRYSNNLPSIIFCHSKLDTENLADSLATAYNIGERDNHCSIMASKAKQARLQRVLLYGVAFHHAGLESDDRKLVETFFRTSKIKVLCATSTLAMGVNLPAHLVVIMGTKAWRGTCNGYQDMDDASLLQMIGRAGRPGFDTSGTAVIMTDNDSKARYEKIAKDGNGEAKSMLLSRLVESINAEISQRVVTNIDDAVNWIKTTLFYIQLQRNPSLHGINTVSAFSVDAYVLRICKEAVYSLEKIDSVIIVGEQDVIPKPGCHIMSQHLVSCQAMEKIQQVPNNAKLSDILRVISQIDGLHQPVRRSEKKILNEAHKEIKMFKLDGPASKVRVQLPWEKAFVLLQVYIDNLESDMPFALRQQMISIVEFASRMLAAMEDYSSLGSKNGNLIVQTLKLRRSLTLRQWCTGESQLQQLPGVSKSLSFTLHVGGIATFSDVLKYSDSDLEKRANRRSPFGAELRRACTGILRDKLTLKANLLSSDIHDESSILRIVVEKQSVVQGTEELIATNDISSQVRYSIVAFTDEEGGCLLYRSDLTKPVKYDVSIPSNFAMVSIYLIASTIGLDEKVVIQGTLPNQDNSSPISATRTRLLTNRTTRPKIRQPQRSGQQIPKRGMGMKTMDISVQADDVVFGNVATPALKITPSPKSTIPQLEKHQYLTQPSKDDHNVVQESSMIRSNEPKPLRGPYGYDSNMSKEMSIRRNAAPTKIDVPVTIGRQSSHDCSSVMNQFAPRNTSLEHDESTPWYLHSRWKRTKREQTKVQKRAFVSGRENPFSQYKHDPNDTESYLDSLSYRGHSRLNRTRIPEPLNYAVCDGRNGYDKCMRAPAIASRSNFPRQWNSVVRSSNEDLLASKAREAALNSFTSQSLFNSPTGGSVHRPPIFDTRRDRFVSEHYSPSPCWPHIPSSFATTSETRSSHYPRNSNQYSQSILMEAERQRGDGYDWRLRSSSVVPTHPPSDRIYPGSHRIIDGANGGGYTITSNGLHRIPSIPDQERNFHVFPQRVRSGVSAYPMYEHEPQCSEWSFF